MKKIIAVMLSVMVLASSSAFANDQRSNDNDKNDNKNDQRQEFKSNGNKDNNKKGYEAKNNEKAQTLHKLGLFAGTSTAVFDPNLEDGATRAEAIVMVGKALGWVVDMTKKSVPNYPDVPEWAAPYVIYAMDHHVTQGIGHQKFGAGYPVSQRMMYTWYARALLFTQDVWANPELLVSMGFITQEQATRIASESSTVMANRDILVGILFDSLQWKEHGSNMKLIQRLVNNAWVNRKDAEDCGVIHPVTQTMTFNATELSLTTVRLDFDKALNQDTVLSNYFDVKVNGVTNTNFVLSKTNQAVYVIFNSPLVIGDKVAITSKLGIKSSTGLDVKVETKTLEMKSMVPSVKETTLTSAKTIKITFSEPIATPVTNVHAYVYIDSTEAIGTYAFSEANTVLTLELTNVLQTGTHTLKIIGGLLNNSGLAMIEFNKVLTADYDVTSPTVVSVTVIDRTHLSILFNETINKTEGRIIVGEDTAMNSYNTAEAVVTDKTAVLELEAALPASVATSNMLLTVKGIKDLSGNAINATTGLVYPFMAPNDVTAPIALVSVTVDNKIEIVFGEKIDEFVAADYTLVNAADTTVVIPSTFTYTPLTLKAVVLLNTLPTVTTNYILKLKDTILDQSVNQVKLVEKDYSVQIVIPVPVVTP